MQEIEETTIRRYLLGQLDDPPAAAAIDERIVLDDDFFASVEEIENGLIDEFVAGRLSPQDRTSFTTRFLVTADRRERLKFTQELRRGLAPPAGVAAPPPPARIRAPIAWGALAAAAVVVVAVGLWRADRGVDPTQPTQPTPTGVSPQVPPPATVFSVILAPGTRGTARQEIALTPAVSTVRFRLQLNTAARDTRYVAHIDGSPANETWPATRASDAEVVVDIPSGNVPSGAFILNLSADRDGRLVAIEDYAVFVRRP